MEAVVERPTLQDQQLARESLPLFTKAIAQKELEQGGIQIQANSLSITIPDKALHLLAVILSGMAQGKTISLIPSDSEVSTQQAAGILNVSRPHIVKLLEDGIIPFKKVGSHRRMLLEDVLVYANQQKETRKENLQFLTQQAQELNLGYEWFRFDVEAQHPDDFVTYLLELNPEVVVQAFHAQVANLKNPPKTAQEVIQTLRKAGLETTAHKLANLLQEWYIRKRFRTQSHHIPEPTEEGTEI